MRLDLGRLPDDGQRHFRCGAKGGDVAIGQPVGVVLAAVLDLKVQPRAPAFAAPLAAVGFAGQVPPGAGAVLDPVAGDAGGRVHIQAEALGAASFAQAEPEFLHPERHFHALGQVGLGIAAHQFGNARVAAGDQLAVLATGRQGLVAGRTDGDLLAVFDAVAVAVTRQAGRAIGAQQAGGLVLLVVGQAVAVRVRCVWRIRYIRWWGGGGGGDVGGNVGRRFGREAGRVVAGGFLHRLRVVAGAGVVVGNAHLLALGHGVGQRQRDGLGRCIHDHAGDGVARAIDQHHKRIVGRVMGLLRVQRGFIAVLQYQLPAVHRGADDGKDGGVYGVVVGCAGTTSAVAVAISDALVIHADLAAGVGQAGRGGEGGGPDSAVGCVLPQVAQTAVVAIHNDGSVAEAGDGLAEGERDGGGFASSQALVADRHRDLGRLSVDAEVAAGAGALSGVALRVPDVAEVHADGVFCALDVGQGRLGGGPDIAVGADRRRSAQRAFAAVVLSLSVFETHVVGTDEAGDALAEGEGDGGGFANGEAVVADRYRDFGALGVDADGGLVERLRAIVDVAGAVPEAVQIDANRAAGARQVRRGCEGGPPDSAVGRVLPQVAH